MEKQSQNFLNQILKPQSNLQKEDVETIFEHFISENDLFVEPYKELWKKILGTAFYVVQVVSGFILLTFIRYERGGYAGSFCTSLNQLTSWKYLIVSTFPTYPFV